MFKNLSDKQVMIMIWWKLKQFKKKFKQIVLTGAIRTGKTDLGFRSFFNWSLSVVLKTKEKVKGYNSFLIIGATRDTVYENIIEPFIIILRVRGFKQVDSYRQLSKQKKGFFHNSSNGRVTLKYRGHKITYKYVGANNKRSVISIQGGTRRGIFIDEAALIPLTIIENAIGRVSSFTLPPYEDGLVWHTTNPEGSEEHEYFQTYIKSGIHKDILVISFQLTDNPKFTEKHVAYYRKVFTKAMFLRKVLGKWVKGVGGIYQKFDKHTHVQEGLWDNMHERGHISYRIGIDYGESDATTFEFEGVLTKLRGLDALNEYYHRNSERSYKTIDDYCDDFFDFIDEINEHMMELFGKIKLIEVNIDSANLTVYNFFRKEAAKRKYRNLHFIKTNKMQKLQKGNSDQNEQKAIKERIAVTNMLIGAGMLNVDKEKCPHLASALEVAIWDKKGNREDDNTLKFNPVDVLDAFEYGWLDLLKMFVDKIVFFRNKK